MMGISLPIMPSLKGSHMEKNACPIKWSAFDRSKKRVGSRLKNKSKEVKLADGKGLAGKGKLTDGKIDVLQNYYGLAIRENLTDVDKIASTNENPQRDLCPDGDDSWCEYKRDEESYKHKNEIPKCIVEVVKPIYDDLSKIDLLIHINISFHINISIHINISSHKT